MKTNKTNFRRSRLATGVVAAIALSLSNVTLAGDTSMALDIKTQKIGSALMSLGERAGVQIMFPNNVGQLPGTIALKGEYTLTSALDAMLAGTGLEYEFTSDSSILITEETRSNGDADEKEADEEVVVTGSRLRSTKTFSPIQVIDREYIKRRGFTNMEDLLRSISSNQSDVNSSTVLEKGQRFTSPTGQGNSTIDLRGLGSGNTLILLNGRRMSGAAGLGTNAGANIDGIPAGAIDRIEIMTDGGSAIYGSDAVAGTVNIILRKDYVGSETTIRYEDSANGGDAHSFTQAFGLTWNSGSVMTNISYNKSLPSLNRKIGMTSNDLRSIGGNDERVNLFAVAGATYWTHFGIAQYQGPYGTIRDGADPNNITLDDIDVDPSNALLADLYSEVASAEVERRSFLLNFKQELTDSLDVFIDASYNETESYGENIYGATFGNNSYVLLEDLDDVFDPDNRFQRVDAMLIYGGFAEAIEAGLMPVSESLGTPKDSNITVGLNWDLPVKDWELVSEYSQSTSRTNTGHTNRVLLDERRRPTKLIEAIADGSFNPFDMLSNSPEAFAQFLGPYRANNAINHVDTFTGYVEGELMDLSMGEVRAVVGTEYRKEDSSGFINQFTALPTRTLTAFFTEVAVPLVSESQGIPGVHSLDIKLAARHEEYTVKGDAVFGLSSPPVFVKQKFSHTSPNISLSWQITPEFRLNASFGESFRAPTARDLFRTQSISGNRPFFDPRAPGADGEEPGREVRLFIYNGGNPSLKPETSNTSTISFNWEPEFIDGLSVNVAYNKIDFSNRIGRLNLFDEQIRLEVISNPELDDLYAPRDESGNLTHLVARPVNRSFALNETTDVTLRYDFDAADWGYFMAEMRGTYISTNETVGNIGEEPVDWTGNNRGNSDRVRASATLSWDLDNYGASLTYSHASSNDALVFNSQIFDYVNVGRVEGISTWDLSGHYKMDSGWEILAGVRNLFHEKAATAPVYGLNYDPRRTDPRGRVIFAEMTKSFDW